MGDIINSMCWQNLVGIFIVFMIMPTVIAFASRDWGDKPTVVAKHFSVILFIEIAMVFVVMLLHWGH